MGTLKSGLAIVPARPDGFREEVAELIAEAAYLAKQQEALRARTKTLLRGAVLKAGSSRYTIVESGPLIGAAPVTVSVRKLHKDGKLGSFTYSLSLDLDLIEIEPA